MWTASTFSAEIQHSADTHPTWHAGPFAVQPAHMSSPKSSYHHGDLRSALLQTATDMITEGGVESVTMRGLAQRVGVSRTAPYRHFEDKTALLIAVAEEGFRRLAQKVVTVRKQENVETLARCQLMGQAYMLFAVENATHYRLMFGENALRFEDAPAIQEAARAAYRELYEIVKQGQAEGIIVDRSPRDIAFLLWGSAHGIAQLIIDGYLPSDDAERMASFVTNTVTHGLLKRP